MALILPRIRGRVWARFVRPGKERLPECGLQAASGPSSLVPGSRSGLKAALRQARERRGRRACAAPPPRHRPPAPPPAPPPPHGPPPPPPHNQPPPPGGLHPPPTSNPTPSQARYARELGKKHRFSPPLPGLRGN